MILKEQEMASLNEKGVDYQQKIEELENQLEEERVKRENTERELQEREEVTVGNGGPRMSVSVLCPHIVLPLEKWDGF